MADDDHGTRIIGQVILEPQRTFEIEIIGRLIQQQQIGRGKQCGSECDAHAPAAREFLTRPRLVRGAEAEAVKDGGGTSWR
jgi:hypothetical protein